MKTKVLLFIYQLSGGGAEKIMIEIANNFPSNYDVTVKTILNCISEKHRLNSNINYEYCFERKYRFDRILFKIGFFLSPKFLHKFLISKKYDIEIAAMEGIASKVISGCSEKKTFLLSLIHASCKNIAWQRGRYLNKKQEFGSYSAFHKIVFVSEDTKNDFIEIFPINKSKCEVIYNPFNIEEIRNKSNITLNDFIEIKEDFVFCTVGRLEEVKGFERLIKAMKENIKVDPKIKLLIIGEGKLKNKLKEEINSNGLNNNIFLIGFKENPYPYIKASDCYICSSYSEGLSTSVIEALILSKPVITTKCGGMREILNNGEFGLIVDNSYLGLIDGIKEIKANLIYYKNKCDLLSEYILKFDKISYFEKFENLFEMKNL